MTLIPRRTTAFLGLSVVTILIVFTLLFTRFGVYIVFDILADIGAKDTSGYTYQDAPVTVTEILTDPTKISLPTQIDQVSGILRMDETLVLSTDQSEFFTLDLSDPTQFEGGNLFPSTPLLMRQGSLEGVTWTGKTFRLVGEHGAFVQVNNDYERIEDAPLPVEIAAFEYSGLTVGPRRYFFSVDGTSDITTMDRTSGVVKTLTLDFGALQKADMTEGSILWSGIAYDDGLIYLAADTYPIIVTASADDGTVENIFGIEGPLQFSDVAVSGGKVYLPRDHNYFDVRPPLLVFDLPDSATTH